MRGGLAVVRLAIDEVADEGRAAGLKDQRDAFTKRGSGEESMPRKKLDAIGREVRG